jgi:hypothetical protein
VDAENIVGVVPVARGGTGATNLTTFKSSLVLDKINNTSDADKPISTKTQTALDLKLNAADTSKYTKQSYTDAALLTKFNLADTGKYTKQVYTDSSLITKLKLSDTASMLSNRIGKDTLNLSARINAKANTSDVNTVLALKANTIDITTSLSSKVDKVTGKELSTNDYSNAEKAKLAAITGTNTGDQDLSSYATNTALALKANISDVNTSLSSKVDKVTGKELSTNDYSNVEKAKLAAITGTNTGDQDLSSYATNTALALKANASDVNTSLSLKANSSDVTTSLSSKVDKISGKELSTNDYSNVEKAKLAAITGTNTGDQDLSSYATNTTLALKANASDVNTSLSLKANASDVTTSLSSKVDKVTGKELSTNDYSNAEKAKLAAITGTNTGDQDLSNYATNTSLASKANILDVTASLALKEDALNKSSATDLGGISPSDVLYPTQKAVKDYITANVSSGVADGGITTIKLADLAVTDSKLATGISKSKVGLSNVENVAINSWTGTSSLTTVGTISSGTWSGTTIALPNGGTGATNAAAARVNLGLVIGTNVQAPLIPGTDYQTPLIAGSSYMVPNSSITGATKTKITYDTKGLITAGSDATTADIAPSTNRNYVTDAQTGVISNTSGINTGDETTSSIKSKLGITTLSGSNTGDQTNVTGNAGTATKLATARKINNVDFDGSVDITVNVDAGTLTGTTLNATVTESSLTSVGIISSGTWSGTTIPLTTGGTGATSASAARANLGLVIGTNVQAPLVAGTDYQTPLTAGINYIVPNSAIAGATKTKITYDTKGLITAGADATTSDIAPSTDKNYITDIQLALLNVTSGTNTGDQTSIIGNAGTASKLATPININNIPFDGSADITIAVDAGNLTGTALNSAITGSSLKSVGTIESGTWSGSTISVSHGGTGATSLSYGILKANGPNAFTVASSADFPTLNQSTTGQAGSLSNIRSIHGGNFNGTGDVSNIITSNFGGTGNGFTKFTGPTSSEKTFTLPDADVTILTTNDIITVAQGGTGTNTLSGLLKGNGSSAFTSATAGTDYLAPNGSAIDLTNFPTLNQNTTGSAGSATKLSTTRYIHGGAYDGTADVTNVISPIYGGTGNAYTNFYTTATDVKTYILPAVSATILTSNDVVTVAQGGTSTNTLALNNVLLGNGTSALKTVAPGTSGNVLTSNGTTWASAAPSGGGSVTSLNDLNDAKIQGSSGSYNFTGGVLLGHKNLSNLYYGLNTTAVGIGSIENLNNGHDNTAVGFNSMKLLFQGDLNTAVGSQSLYSVYSGTYNTAVGFKSLYNNTNSQNTAVGYASMLSNTSGSLNTAVGYQALQTNVSGVRNTALGSSSLLSSTGDYNTAAGFSSLSQNTSGYGNSGFGIEALVSNTTGYYNTSIGYQSGIQLISGHNNTLIGYNSQPSSSSVNNEITLGDASVNKIRSGATSITALSDLRDKTDIVNILEGINFVKQLRPVTFTWNTRDKAKVGIKSAGFIAQELLALQKGSSIGINLDLVSEDNPDKLEARYGNLLPVMVKAIQEQQTIIEDQKRRLEVLEKLVNELIKKQ